MVTKSIFLRSVMLLVLVSLVSSGARADSLSGWWKLDESSGTVAEDSSGSGNYGTVYGDAEWEDGVMVGGLNFDAVGDCVYISNPSVYSTEADFTWSAWIRLLDGQDITDGGVIIAKCPDTGDYGNGAKCLYVAADGKMEFNVNGVVTLSTETYVNDGLWHHVALTVEFETSGSNDTAKLYIDGDLPDDATKDNWNVNQYDESDALKIGFANNNFPQSPDQTYFYGRIDDVRIYDYVLDDANIAALFDDSGYWRFVVTCDSRDDGDGDGVNDDILGEIADAIIAEKAEFVVFPGDLVNGSTSAGVTEEQLNHWKSVMNDVYTAGITVIPVRGNHENKGEPDDWTNVFAAEIPDNGPAGEVDFTYYRTNRNALFIGLDIYFNEPLVNQNWLNDVLADNTWRHVFVFTHEPAFGLDGGGAHDDGLYGDKNPFIDFTDERDEFWGSLEDEPGCRLYFCGHDHFYDHLKAVKKVAPDIDTEVHQMIVGTAGAPLRDFTGDDYYDDSDYWTPTNIKHEGKEVGDYCYGYVVVEIWGGSNVTTQWMRRINTETSDPSGYESGEDVWSFTYDCFPSEHDATGEPPEGGSKAGYWYVGLQDLNVLISAWKILEPADPPTPSGPGIGSVPGGICADFGHSAEGGAKAGFWRVGIDDLNILIDNWKVLEPADPPTPSGPGVPPNCLECSKGQQAGDNSLGKEYSIEEMIIWFAELWLIDEEVRKTIDEDDWQKFVESVKEGT